MLLILTLSTIPAVLAAGLDSVGLAVMAIAGVVWATGVSLCSSMPLVTTRSGPLLNDRLAVGLSALAAGLATAGIALLVL